MRQKPIHPMEYNKMRALGVAELKRKQDEIDRKRLNGNKEIIERLDKIIALLEEDKKRSDYSKEMNTATEKIMKDIDNLTLIVSNQQDIINRLVNQVNVLQGISMTKKNNPLIG